MKDKIIHILLIIIIFLRLIIADNQYSVKQLENTVEINYYILVVILLSLNLILIYGSALISNIIISISINFTKIYGDKHMLFIVKEKVYFIYGIIYLIYNLLLIALDTWINISLLKFFQIAVYIIISAMIYSILSKLMIINKYKIMKISLINFFVLSGLLIVI
ncbi:hypothetical protein [Gemella cuniculi]|uniref:hypothetical protein n=1 Tax=Gemella cuniculi TaxID=150240 RepID=UPI00040C6E84|nr:hypothetical protein [Gemella cuniculi]